MKVLSRIDPDTYYVVTSIHVRMVRNGDKLTIPYCHIPEKAKLFRPEIQAELLAFWEERNPEHPCKICGKVFRAAPKKVYCSPECQVAGKRAIRQACASKRKPPTPSTQVCEYCEKLFTAATVRKYCSQECKTAAITIKQHEAREKRAEKKTEKKKSHLEEKMKLAASMGIDYGELQRRETLKQVGKVVI